tara:strand:- start:3780 stop:3953 length:174 start_codon:yes stop_codon:yes gene_type:complete
MRFLVDSMVIPEHLVTVAEAAPYLGVMEVATQQGKVSIGHNADRQIAVRSGNGPSEE